MSGVSEQNFEGDHPLSKTSESNILAASKELMIQSLTFIRDENLDFFGK